MSAPTNTTAPALADEPGALTAENAEVTLDELLGSLARVSISGGQQFEEKRRRFLSALRAALQQPAAAGSDALALAEALLDAVDNADMKERGGFRGRSDIVNAAERLRAALRQPAAASGAAPQPRVLWTQDEHELADALFSAWSKAEPAHSITQHPLSYRATFLDMARAALEGAAAPAAAPQAQPIGYINPGDLEQMRLQGRGGLLWHVPVDGATQPVYAAPAAAQTKVEISADPELLRRAVQAETELALLAAAAQPAQPVVQIKRGAWQEFERLFDRGVSKGWIPQEDLIELYNALDPVDIGAAPGTSTTEPADTEAHPTIPPGCCDKPPTCRDWTCRRMLEGRSAARSAPGTGEA